MIERFKQGLYLQQKRTRIPGLSFSFANISDLHFDGTNKFPQWLRTDVANYLNLHATQLLTISGDIVDKGEEYVEEALDWLRSLQVNYILISPGNHDEEALDKLIGLTVKDPKIHIGIHSTFEYGNANFIMMPDPCNKYFSSSMMVLPSLLHSQKINIILSHNPNSAIYYDASIGPDYMMYRPVVLAGHTHGGQICHADFLSKVFSKVIKRGKILGMLRINHEHDCFKLQGKCKLPNLDLYINNGLGTHQPGRLFCPPMIRIFHG